MALNQEYVGRVFGPTEPYEVSRVKIADFANAIGESARPLHRASRGPPPPLSAGEEYAVKADPNLFGSPAKRVCAEHDRQLGGESPLPSLMVAKG